MLDLHETVPRSLVRATEIDVLPIDRVVVRREDHLVVRSPGNPDHFFGNLLVFDRPPAAGDRGRWESLFDREFVGAPEVRHRTFAWDRSDGTIGMAKEEFCSHGYYLERTVGLVAAADEVHAHERENTEVLVRALDPRDGADERLWEQVLAIQMAGRDERFAEDVHLAFSRRRLAELRELFRAGRGGWYVALDPGGREVRGSCGVVVTGDRGRFQAVDTARAHRRKGVCSRLIVAAAKSAAAEHGARRLVICADPDYHALGIYESLGFQAIERGAAVCLQPPAA